jgi:hypothetical protein
MHDLGCARVGSAGASAYCDIANGEIEIYVKLTDRLAAGSTSSWHRLP